MPLYRDEGVVIRTHKLGEADRIITLFTQNRGMVRAVARGVRRTSSKFGARLEPFMLVDVQCYEGRSLDTIAQVELISPYGREISGNFDLFRTANVIVETAEKLNTDGPARQQFRLLVGALRTLSEGTIPGALVRDAYLLRSIALAGWAPSFVDCANCGTSGPHSSISIQQGGVVCENCRPAGSIRVATETVDLLGSLLGGDWESVLQSSRGTREQTSGVTAAYVQWHLERGIRSLSVRGDG